MDKATFDPTGNFRQEESVSTFDTSPGFPWEEYGLADQSALHSFDQSSHLDGAHGQTSLLHGTFTINDHISSHDISADSRLFTKYTAAFHFPEPPTPYDSPAGANNQSRPPINEEDAHHSEGHLVPIFNRHWPPQNEVIDFRSRLNEETPTADGYHTSVNYYSPSPTEQSDTSRKRKNRNKVASEKFRAKTRADTRILEHQERSMEDINQDLIGCVAGLKHEVYELKTQILQHGLCNNDLIQTYISNEAKRFVDQLEQEDERLNPIYDDCNGERYEE